MARPHNKKDLLEQATNRFDELMNLIKTFDEKALTQQGVNGEWGVKDILAHVDHWHGLMETWYQIGMAGNKPEMPAPGYTWKTTPELNQKIYKEHKHDSLKEVTQNLKSSHQMILKLVQQHSNEKLFTKKKYAWTGSTSMGSYFISATSSHYDWAIKLIKKWQKIF